MVLRCGARNGLARTARLIVAASDRENMFWGRGVTLFPPLLPSFLLSFLGSLRCFIRVTATDNRRLVPIDGTFVVPHLKFAGRHGEVDFLLHNHQTTKTTTKSHQYPCTTKTQRIDAPAARTGRTTFVPPRPSIFGRPSRTNSVACPYVPLGTALAWVRPVGLVVGLVGGLVGHVVLAGVFEWLWCTWHGRNPLGPKHNNNGQCLNVQRE